MWAPADAQDDLLELNSENSVMNSEAASIEYLGTWCEFEGREGEKAQKWRPLMDTLRFFVGIKNTGTTVIDRYVWKQTIDLSNTKMKLLHPRIPAQLWRPFAAGVLSSVFVREVRIRGGGIEVVNPVLNRRHDVVPATPITPGGVKPGETLIVGETKPYVDLLIEGVEAKGVEMGTEAQLEILNRQKGVVRLVVKEFSVGPITIHDMKAEAVLKGKFKALHEVSIDGKMCGGGEVEWEYV